MSELMDIFVVDVEVDDLFEFFFLEEFDHEIDAEHSAFGVFELELFVVLHDLEAVEGAGLVIVDGADLFSDAVHESSNFGGCFGGVGVDEEAAEVG